MHIALDVSSAVRPEATGVAMHIRRLVAALARVDAEDRFTLVHRLARLKARGEFVRPPAPNFRTKLMLEGFHPFFGRQVDVFHGLDARLPGPWMKARLVVTIHDVFSALQSNDFATPEFRALKAARYRDLVARAERIIVMSETCRRDVLATLHPDPARLRVVYSAAGEEFHPRGAEEVAAVRARYGLERPYLLYVGTINRRKNVPAMVRAFAQARARTRSDVRLAIAGRVGFGGEELREAIASVPPAGREDIGGGAADAVKLLGYVPDEDVPALYCGAWGLLFVTLYEGFGIPVVEAFSCGCPVLGTTAGSVPEVAGGAALLADPKNVEEIAAQIEKLLTGEALRAELRQKGLARARDFSWEKSARACVEVYRELRGG